MKPRDQESTLIKSNKRNAAYKLFSVIIIAGFLATASGEILRAQNPPAPAPAPAPTPEAAPKQVEPPEAPEAPEPPEPAEPPEADQLFVLNDGAGRLGVTLSEVTSEKAVELKLPTVAGAIVDRVQKNSAAAKAGLEAGDAIIEFDGVHIRSCGELRRLIRETPPGRTVAIKIFRYGKPLILTATVEESSNQFSYNMPEMRIPPMDFKMPKMDIPPMIFPDAPFAYAPHRVTLGIAGDDLTPQLAKYFGVKQGAGVLISEITLGGAADKAGLKAGDVITHVDAKPVRSVEDLRTVLNEKFPGDTRKVNLTIVREHREQNVSAELTHSQPLERHVTKLAAPASKEDAGQVALQIQQLRDEARKLGIDADQLPAWPEAERAQIMSDELQQQKLLRTEWLRQFQQQMLMLKDLQQTKNLHIQSDDDGEI